MKHTLKALTVLVLLIFSLTGCFLVRGEIKEVKVVLKNSTEYELNLIYFNIGQTAGTYSPMHYLITSETENLKIGEERVFVVSMYESDFGNEGLATVFVKDREIEYNAGWIVLNPNGKNEENRFEITCDSEMNFSFEPALLPKGTT